MIFHSFFDWHASFSVVVNYHQLVILQFVVYRKSQVIRRLFPVQESKLIVNERNFIPESECNTALQRIRLRTKAGALKVGAGGQYGTVTSKPSSRPTCSSSKKSCNPSSNSLILEPNRGPRIRRRVILNIKQISQSIRRLIVPLTSSSPSTWCLRALVENTAP